MDLQAWLIVVGVAIILGILFDGLRRMHLAKKDSLKMSRDLGGQIDVSPLDDDFNPELPGGSVRVLASGVDSGENDFDDMPSMSADVSERDIPLDPSSVGASLASTDEQAAQKASDTSAKASGSTGAKVDRKSGHNSAHSGDKQAENDGQSDAVDDAASAVAPDGEHEVIVINVDARSGQAFSGAAIDQLLLACGMKHGEMSIYHRHEEGDLLSPIQFSVANAVEPGYFDQNEIDTLTTPGVSFFMSVPGPKDYLEAFDFMHSTAKCFADNLEGDLKDENRSVLTAQTVEHYKQRIRDFERKQLCKARP